MFSALGETVSILLKFSLSHVFLIFLIFSILIKKLGIYEKVHFSAPFPPKAGNAALAQGFY